MSRQEVIQEVSADNVRRHVEHITTSIPSRLAGSPNAHRMAEYSLQALRDAGADARIQELPGLVSFPERAELRIIAPSDIAIEANTLGHSVPTLPDGISGELMDVASGSFEDYAGRDATGKITLSELSYSPARHEKQRISGLMGAIGCVMMNWGHPENAAVPFGSVKPAWGNPTPNAYKAEMPTLPCIGIARTAGLQIRKMLQNGPVRVWFRANVENGWRPVQITLGELKSQHSEEFVLVGGHQDSWQGPQATDNAAGNACLMELARVFGKHRDELRRGLVFGFWTGHETGTMVGSSWFADHEWDRLRRHAVGYVQIDQPACAGTSEWSTGSNAELRRMHQAVEHEMLGGRPIHWHRAAKNGDSSFFGLGIPMIAGEGAFKRAELEATALAGLGWWHHSIENTIDKLDWTFMQDHLRVYAGWVWEMATAPILPFEFVSVADQFIERLTALRTQGDPIGLTATIQRAQDFRTAAAALDTTAETWRVRYAKGDVEDDVPATILNTCLKRLSRALVPLASTACGTYGHDVYGYTPQGTMIPSLYDTPRLGRLAADSEDRWMLEVQLIRERNRVTDALGDCCLLVEDTLRQLR
ncbi:MAG: M28 family peptidase [Rhodopila sp.]